MGVCYRVRVVRALLLVVLAAAGCRGRVAEAPPAVHDGIPAAAASADVVVEPYVAPPCTDFAPGPRRSRLLTRAEYDATVHDLLGVASWTEGASATFPPASSLTGFENDAASNAATAVWVEAAMRAAESTARTAWTERRDALLPCVPADVGEQACGEMLVRSLGARALRRPLAADELAVYDGLFESARAQWGFDKAGELVIAALLQAPRFLYLIEDPIVDDYAIASRLSYLLWGSLPDDALFAAAAAGALSSREEVAAQARRMLGDARARRGLRGFFRQWLGLDRLATTQKDQATFPTWTPDARASWRASVDAFLEHVLFDGAPTIERLLTSPTVFLDPVLSSTMGISVDHDGMAPAELPDERAGILTQPALLALLAAADQGSPVRRGVFVREKILCQAMPPPPPDVVVEPPDPDPSLTTRERYAAHTADESCTGCHSMIDPIGFGFERYDALGRWRTVENGLPIDATGFLDAIGEPDVEGAFDGAIELAQKLARSERVRRCVAKQAFRYATARVEDGGDRCTIDELESVLATTNGDLKELFVAVAASAALRASIPGEEP